MRSAIKQLLNLDNTLANTLKIDKNELRRFAAMWNLQLSQLIRDFPSIDDYKEIVSKKGTLFDPQQIDLDNLHGFTSQEKETIDKFYKKCNYTPHLMKKNEKMLDIFFQ